MGFRSLFETQIFKHRTFLLIKSYSSHGPTRKLERRPPKTGNTLHLSDRNCSPWMFYNEGFRGRRVWGSPPQCQSRPSIAAKKRIRRKTQIRDKTIEKYTSISSDVGGIGGGGDSGTEMVRGMWRSQGGAARFLMGLSRPPGDQDHLRRNNLKQKK